MQCPICHTGRLQPVDAQFKGNDHRIIYRCRDPLCATTHHMDYQNTVQKITGPLLEATKAPQRRPN